MKHLICFLLALSLIFSVFGCSTKKETTEIIIFAASSLEETLTKIGDHYEKDHPDTTLTFSFESSGTLKTQIEEGADCDLFLSASQKQMNQLSELSMIQEDTRFDLLENEVVLAVPVENPAGILSLFLSIFLSVFVYAAALLLTKALEEDDILALPKGKLLLRLARKSRLLR